MYEKVETAAFQNGPLIVCLLKWNTTIKASIHLQPCTGTYAEAVGLPSTLVPVPVPARWTMQELAWQVTVSVEAWMETI